MMSRLEPSTVEALNLAGWYSGRRADLSAVVPLLELQGYAANPAAVKFLESFLGLKVEPANTAGPNFSNDEPLLVDPLGVGRRHHAESVAVGAEIGGSWFPVGWWLSYCHVFMNQNGAMAAYANRMIWSLGRTPHEGLDLMISANRPLVCVYAPEGMPPWPRPDMAGRGLR